ncbi:MAG: hypothetical protein ABIK53_05290 [bacterium]
MRAKILYLTGLIFTAAFLAAAQLRGILSAFGPRINNHIAAAQGVIQGLPHWRVYQSRVLGPFFVKVISKLTGLTFGQAYPLAVFIMLFSFFLILILIARRLWNSTIAALATAIAAWALNTMLMQELWLYPWDYIDLTVFTLLTWAILVSQPFWVIGCILAFEVFNRGEVVIILSTWFIIDSIFRLIPSEIKWPRLRVEIHRRQFFVALALLVVGYTVIEVLRNVLLIREIRPEIFSDMKEGIHFVNLRLLRNLRELCLSFTHPLQNFVFNVFNVFIFSIPLFALRAIFYKHIGVIRISLLYLVLWGFTVTFGLIYETRVWLSFVPFLVLAFPMVFSNILKNSGNMEKKQEKNRVVLTKDGKELILTQE